MSEETVGPTGKFTDPDGNENEFDVGKVVSDREPKGTFKWPEWLTGSSSEESTETKISGSEQE